jgi:fibronectin type 3 domain-containing protein
MAVGEDSTVWLSWNAPLTDGGAAVTGYRLYWSTSRNGQYTAINVVGTSYLHDGVSNGHTYYYKLSAVNAAGEGSTTDVVSATPQARPGTPLELTAEAQDGHDRQIIQEPAP